MCFEENPAMENCENIQESLGEICVHCNKCGRYNVEYEKGDVDE